MNFRQRILNREKVCGNMMRMVRNPGVCYLAKNSGVDFILYDCEHAEYDIQTLHDLFLMGRALSLPSLARVPFANKETISRTLDQGCDGLMVPMVSSAQMAKDFVQYARYKPQGIRGMATGVAFSHYQMPKDMGALMAEQNEQVLTIAQIETEQGVDAAEEIAAVEGLDMLLIGPSDLSIALGVPGDSFHPKMQEAIAHVIQACKKHGKALGMHAPQKVLNAYYEDLTMISTQSEIDFLRAGFENVKAMFEQMKHAHENR